MSVAFLTGATGSVGIYLLRELCERTDVHRIFCLVRRRGAESGQSRLAEHARQHGFHLPPHVIAVHGDMRQPRLGLNDFDYGLLARQVTHVFHSAADVRFNQTIDVMRRTNVGGTRAVLDFCELARATNPDFAVLSYVGTAYVAKDRATLALESLLDRRDTFRNTYEQSKYEAERLVRSRRSRVPTIIFRPSIVWSLDGDGRMQAKSAVYPAIKLYLKWPVPMIPVHENTLDVVPVDFVARATCALGMDPSHVGECYHLAVGHEGDLSLRRFYGILGDAFREAGHPRRIYRLPMWAWRPCWKIVKATFLRRMRSGAAWDAYFPYVQSRNPRFDVTRSRAALARHGIRIPTSEETLRGTVTGVVEGLLKVAGASAPAAPTTVARTA
jgi:long-chain acyl-CoA synthetase